MNRFLHRAGPALQILWRPALYAVFAIVWALPFWTHAGQCIIGLHDWGWACYPQQTANQLVATFAPWSENGLGHIAVLPSTSPIALAAPALALIAPRFALAFVLTIAVFCALLGCAQLLRYIGVRTAPAEVLGAGLYVASPFFVTKLISGHIAFILALAALPFAFRALLAISRGEAYPFAYGLLWTAITATQLQIACIFLLCSAVVFRLPFKRLIALWGLVAITYLPAAFVTLFALFTGGVDHPVQLSSWIASQSIPLRHILDGEHYFAQYYVSAANVPAQALYALAGLAAALALFVSGGALRRLIAVTISLGIVAGGSLGALGFVVKPLLLHFPAAGVFRELYDLLALVPLATSLGMGLLFTRVSLRAALGGVVAAALLVIAAGPWIDGGITRMLGFNDPARWAQQAAFVTRQQGNGRALWLPATAPIAVNHERSGGDPFDNAFGAHPSANAYDATGFFAYVAALADSTQTLPDGLLRRANISIVVSRPDLFSPRVSDRYRNPGSAMMRDYGEGSVAALAQGRAACEPDLRSQMKPMQLYVRCGSGLRVSTPPDTSISSGWVDRRVAPFTNPEMENPRRPVLVTTSNVPLHFDNARPERLWLSGRGQACFDDTCAIEVTSTWRPYHISAGAHQLRLNGPGTVMEFRAPEPSADNAGDAHEVPLRLGVSNTFFGFVRIALPPHRAGWLVLREGWSPAWRVLGAGIPLTNPPALADGYACGWKIPQASHQATIIVFNAVALAYVALLICCWMTWAMIFGAAVRSMNISRRLRLGFALIAARFAI